MLWERRQNPVVVGNSLGGYNALSTAAAYPELVRTRLVGGRFSLHYLNMQIWPKLTTSRRVMQRWLSPAWASLVQLHARIAGLLSLHITAEPHPGAPSRLHCTSQVRGVVLINGAGKFDDLDKEGPEQSTDEVSVTLTGEVAQKVCCRLLAGDLLSASTAVASENVPYLMKGSRVSVRFVAVTMPKGRHYTGCCCYIFWCRPPLCRQREARVSDSTLTRLARLPKAPEAWTLNNLMSGPMGLVSKGVVYVSFIFAKQPSRIRSVLMQVCCA